MANKLIDFATRNVRAVANRIDRDKNTPGIQLSRGFASPAPQTRVTAGGLSGLLQKAEIGRIGLQRGIEAGKSRVRQAYEADPLKFTPLSMLSMREEVVPRTRSLGRLLGNEQAGEDIGYGLRGALSLTPFKRSGEKLRASNPTTERQRRAQKIGRIAMGTALTAPISGAAKGKGLFEGSLAAKTMLANVGKRAVVGATAGGVLGGGINALLGGDIEEGVKQGALSGLKAAPVIAVTNPITAKALQVLAPSAGFATTQLTKRTVGAIANALEDEFIADLDEYDNTTKDRIMSFAMGFVLTGNAEVLDEMRRQFPKMAENVSKLFDTTVTTNKIDPKTGKRIKKPMIQYLIEKKIGLQAQDITDLSDEDLGKIKTVEQTKLDINQQVKDINDTSEYIQEQVLKQQQAKGEKTLSTKLKTIKQDVTTKFGDFFAPIEDTLTKAESEYEFKVRPTQDVRIQVDKALRADTIASQFIKDNQLDKVIQQVDDLDEFNQYLIAKHASDVEAQGFKTGRNLNKDAKLVSLLSDKYEPFAQQVNQYNQKLLNYAVQAGLVDENLARSLTKQYPNYVPLKRVFTEVENVTSPSGSGGPASLSSQAFLKRLKGSEREIRDPLESMIEATGVVFRQGERNKIANMVASYKDLPGNPFGLRKLGKSEKIGVKNTISYLENGKKVTYETLPEIAEAAKNLGVDQLSVVLKVARVPTRILQLGAVGMNTPFIAGNLVKDQVTASVLSSKPMATSLANPLNFVRALYEAFGQGKTYDDWVRSGSSFTSFDIARDQARPTVAKIRAGRSAKSKILYTATNPKELLRAVEDIVGKTEEVTRIQQFSGMKDALLAEGRTLEDATALAANASRNNTANFGRRGAWSTSLNAMIPFFNAGIQGARSMMKSVKADPKGFGIRFATNVGVPVATAVLWNISDPIRKSAYDDIPEYEKENNLILLPEKPEKDENGRWKAIKIPINPGISNLVNLIRRPIEGTQAVNFQGVGQMAADLFTASSGVDITSGRKLLSSITPQALKPGIESATNTNLFTGADIVPFYMKNKPKEEQVYPDTSGTVRLIAKQINASPLIVQNAINTATAGTGRQILRASDRLLANAGIIPEEQVGGESVVENLQKRFASAAGGQLSRTPRTIDYAIKKYDLPISLSGVSGEPEAKQGKLKTLQSQDENYKKSVKILDDEQLSDADKSAIIAEMGMNREDVDYYYLASQNSNIRKELVLDTARGIEDHAQLLAYLGNGRKEVNGKALVTSTIINDLVDEGIITYQEGKDLKSLKFDSKTGQARVKVKQSGRGRGAKYKLKVSLTPLSTLIAAANKASSKSNKARFKISKEDLARIQL